MRFNNSQNITEIPQTRVVIDYPTIHSQDGITEQFQVLFEQKAIVNEGIKSELHNNGTTIQ